MDSADAYEFSASEFLRVRDRSTVGSRVAADWAHSFPSGARVLELGCGGGYPITKALHAANIRLWAIDSSPTLVKRFQTRFPDVPVQCCKVQQSTFFDQTYAGVIAIGLIFLLSAPCQQALIQDVANVLLPKGRFLFSAPTQTGEWIDANTGHACLSVGQKRYETWIANAGLLLIKTHVDAGGNHYYELERTV